ncbi:MAG: TIM barrel protein [Elusimicrobiota bacterium]|nr:TIM barrel protein [Elusimicrobiota bacterium]
MKLGISTIYFSRKLTKNLISWEEIEKKIEHLIDSGLSCIELNTDIPLSWIKKIQKWVNTSNIKVSSLHNFCPAVENIPEGKYGFNVYSLTSPDKTEQQLALEYTLRTIDFAQLLEAEVVVLHLGEIITNPSGLEVYKIASQFGVNSEIYKKYKNELLESRRKNREYYFSILYSLLDRIVKHAEQKEIKLGIESRFFPNEIPNFEEINEIISRYKSKFIGYWHDFGHIEIQSRLGFAEGHMNYFNSYNENIFGYHIHGVKGLTDHFSPSNSELKFSNLLNYKNDKLYILEVHGKENFTELIKGIKLIKTILGNGRLK